VLEEDQMAPRRRGERAVIYDRTSVRDESSMAEHLSRCRAYCESQGLEVVAEQTDSGISGFHDRARPGWTEVKRMVEAEEVDVVVFFALSRIERSIVRTFQFAQLCEEHRCAFVSVTEDVNTGGPWGRVILAVLAAAAEIESLTKRERALMGRDKNRADGNWSGGQPAFGFRYEGGRRDQGGTGVKQVVVREQRDLIREAARDVLNGRASTGAIARRWNDAGIRTTGGKEWSRGHVSQVLQAERNVPGIFTETTRQRIVTFFAGRATGSRADRYLLTGLLRCGRCGGRMSARAGTYICNQTGSVHLSIKAEAVERIVQDLALERPDPGAVDVPDPAAPLVQEREEVLDRMRALGEDLNIPETVLAARSAGLQQMLDDLEEQIEVASPPGRFTALLTQGDDVRGWLDTLVETVTIQPSQPGRFSPERVTVEWR
jgi:DNA invertase Pin-like site-specific DNA recombinase